MLVILSTISLKFGATGGNYDIIIDHSLLLTYYYLSIILSFSQSLLSLLTSLAHFFLHSLASSKCNTDTPLHRMRLQLLIHLRLGTLIVPYLILPFESNDFVNYICWQCCHVGNLECWNLVQLYLRLDYLYLYVL